MGAPEATTDDVRVHVHPADQAATEPKRRFFGRKSAPAGATPAGVIPQLRLVDQESGPNRQTNDSEPGSIFGSALLDELEAGQKVAAEAAEDSEWSGELMSPFEALKQTAPAKGEAANWIIWSAMTLAGMARVLLVTLGYLIARGGQTRIRAGVVAGLLVTVLALSFLLSYATA